MIGTKLWRRLKRFVFCAYMYAVMQAFWWFVTGNWQSSHAGKREGTDRAATIIRSCSPDSWIYKWQLVNITIIIVDFIE